MPTIDFLGRNFYMQDGDERTFYNVNTINLHNGVMGYDLGKRALACSAPYLVDEFEKFIKDRPGAVDMLSAPKLNGCHFILVKSKNNPNQFAVAHVNPEDNKEITYKDLFQKFNPDDDLDIVYCGGYSGNPQLLLDIANANGYTLSSLRSIPFLFNVETMVFFEEPKSVHFYFIPSEDQLIIYSENFERTTKPAIHIASGVFSDTSVPICFHEVAAFIQNSNTVISPTRFCQYLPVFTERFLSIYPKTRIYTYQACPDEIAPDEPRKKEAAMEAGFDFITEDTLKELNKEHLEELASDFSPRM